MAATRDVLKARRRDDAWGAHMASVRAAEGRGEPWPAWREPTETPDGGGSLAADVVGGAMPPGEPKSSAVVGGRLIVETTEGTFAHGGGGWVRL
ncbi:hypothetical protein [Chelatococcus sp. XZ-Ab1]|uniref:hypothetical protein n=1 Tax=Chelatococcus sp. XZ-Ab1 TaxID=3034027 RepID=UPI0023E3F06B|nr:hypothetical protein [Chelatococcus sp. XZ-Ab1]